VSSPIDPLASVAWLASHIPFLLAVGWLIRAPILSREEGHEAITREAWNGLALTDEQRRALIRGVRAPDASPLGFLTSLLPAGQRRHALRAWAGTTTAQAIRDTRDYVVATHHRAFALADGPRRWAALGEILHCLQDSFSPAHADRIGARIVRMKHWGPIDQLRSRDEHGFPSDARDRALIEGALTDEARAAADASRAYLELAQRPTASGDSELRGFLDGFLLG
jgi:hypothetical protein